MRHRRRPVGGRPAGGGPTIFSSRPASPTKPGCREPGTSGTAARIAPIPLARRRHPPVRSLPGRRRTNWSNRRRRPPSSAHRPATRSVDPGRGRAAPGRASPASPPASAHRARGPRKAGRRPWRSAWRTHGRMLPRPRARRRGRRGDRERVPESALRRTARSRRGLPAPPRPAPGRPPPPIEPGRPGRRPPRSRVPLRRETRARETPR